MAERRLAAIVFTDLAGFTARAQADEAAALRLLEEHRRLLREELQTHGGTEVKTMGDGSLIEFPNALDATRWALAVQARFQRRNLAHPRDAPINLRIGIHVGEVVRSGEDILGDAVNVASRIEPLAEHGGICISEPVYQLVRNKLPVKLVGLGRQSLHNVELPLEVYKVVASDSVSVVTREGESREPAAPAPSQRVAVLPLRNLSAVSDEYFSDGLTEELISTIGQASGIRTISRTSAVRYKHTEKTIPEIGEELHVGTILEGTVRRSGDRVRISIQLIDVASDEQRWTRIYDRGIEDVFAVQTDIAENVAAALAVELLPKERERIEARPTPSVGAYDLYLQGRYHWHKGTERDLQTAIRLFEKAIEVDPNFAQAYVGLADSHLALCDEGSVDPATTQRVVEPLVRRALELDERLPEAQATMARLVQDYHGNWAEAEKRFRRAIELSPNWAVVCHSYAVHLAMRGRLDQALVEIQRAEALDPYSLGVHNCAAAIYRDAQEYASSIRECRQMLEIDPNFVPALTKLGRAFLETSRPEEGVALMEKAHELSHGGLLATSHLAYAYGRVGRREDALRLIHELERDSEKRFVSPYNIAVAYAGLNDRDATVRWLWKAHEIGMTTMGAIHVDPIFDFVRDDSRFQALEATMGLTAPPSKHSLSNANELA